MPSRIPSQNACLNPSPGDCNHHLSSRKNSAQSVQEIAQSALKAYSRIPGIGSETPSVESIIDAYQRDGHGDRGLLMAILEAKKIEDQRLTTRDNLQLANIRAQSSHWPQPIMVPHGPSLIKTEASHTVFAKPLSVEARPVTGRKMSLSSSSSASSSTSARASKRARGPIPELPLGPEKITREAVKIALEAKIARSKQTQLHPPSASSSASCPYPSSRPSTSNQPRPSLKLAMSSFQPMSNFGMSYQPRDPRPASASTQASSFSSHESSSDPASPSFPPSGKESSPVNSRLKSSLARLLNDSDAPITRNCQ